MKTESQRLQELAGLKKLKNSIIEESYDGAALGDYQGAADYGSNFRPDFPEQAKIQMDANSLKPCLREDEKPLATTEVEPTYTIHYIPQTKIESRPEDAKLYDLSK